MFGFEAKPIVWPARNSIFSRVGEFWLGNGPEFRGDRKGYITEFDDSRVPEPGLNPVIAGDRAG